MPKFKDLDPKLFVQKSFNECEEAYYPSWQIHDSYTEKEDLLSEFKSFYQLDKQIVQDAVISEVPKIYVLHFLEIREMSGSFANLANLYRLKRFVYQQ